MNLIESRGGQITKQVCSHVSSSAALVSSHVAHLTKGTDFECDVAPYDTCNIRAMSNSM